MIYLVGLGVKEGDIALNAYKLITDKSRKIVVKTRHSATYCYFDGSEECLDSVYDEAQDFDGLNSALADAVLKLEEEHGEVVYCVPGSGATDASVRELRARGASIVCYPAADSVTHALCQSPSTSFLAVAAYDVENLVEPDSTLPLVVYEIDNALLAGEVKLVLARYYGDEATVFVNGERTTLDRLDRLGHYDHTTTACVLGQDLLKKTRYTFGDLLRIMTVLTGEDGCPWDKAQTHESICTNMIEEAYEAVDAIRAEDIDNMIEEMGDVLLQAVFHCFIAQKEEEFDTSDVINALCEKLLFRHPHVFGAVRADNADSALASWESAKREEKKQGTLASSLDSIPVAFPQTLRAMKIAKRAAKAGIGDTVDAELLTKVVTDGLQSLGAGDDEYVLGQCLYSISNLCRMQGVDPELAAKRINDLYVARFHAIEAELARIGKTVYEATRAELDSAVAAVVYRENR